MNGKRAIKKSAANYPVKKSLRLVKKKTKDIDLKEKLDDYRPTKK